MSILEKIAEWLRPTDLGRLIDECRTGLAQEGFQPESDDFASLADVGGDRYEAGAAIGGTAAAVANAVRGRASVALQQKIERLAREFPGTEGAAPTAAQRREGFRAELFRADRLLRDAGFAEASAAAYQLAKRLDEGTAFPEAAAADVRKQFEAVLRDGKATEALRALVARLARCAADPKRYLDRG